MLRSAHDHAARSDAPVTAWPISCRTATYLCGQSGCRTTRRAAGTYHAPRPFALTRRVRLCFTSSARRWADSCMSPLNVPDRPGKFKRRVSDRSTLHFVLYASATVGYRGARVASCPANGPIASGTSTLHRAQKRVARLGNTRRCLIGQQSLARLMVDPSTI